MSKSKTEIKGFPRPPKNSGLFPKNPKKVTITLDEAQAKLLRKFLGDLQDSRSDCQCNDVYEDEEDFVREAGYSPRWIASAHFSDAKTSDLVKAINGLESGECDDDDYDLIVSGPSDTTFINWVCTDIEAQLQAQGVEEING